LPCSNHRFLISSLILAHKYTKDMHLNNQFWSTITDGLFSLPDINLMEQQFLALTDYDLSLTPERYQAILTQLSDIERPMTRMPVVHPNTFRVFNSMAESTKESLSSMARSPNESVAGSLGSSCGSLTPPWYSPVVALKGP
ncbi:hypothetical protein HDU98_009593, partial [Podochytrium sp. JEL0797]